VADDLERFEARCRPVVEMRRGEDGTWRGPPESAALLGDRGDVAARTPTDLAGLVLRCWASGVDLTFLGTGGGDVAAASIDPAVWDAVNEYVAACGGDTGLATVGNRRMDAVARVERAIAGPGGGVKGGAGAHAGAGPRRPDQGADYAGEHADFFGTGVRRRPDQCEVCDSDFDDAAAAELCKEIAEEHRRGP
jgi:hypothetical protein